MFQIQHYSQVLSTKQINYGHITIYLVKVEEGTVKFGCQRTLHTLWQTMWTKVEQILTFYAISDNLGNNTIGFYSEFLSMLTLLLLLFY